MVLLTAGSAWAQTQSRPAGDDLARARTHFEAGRALFHLGNYTESVREFAAGYQLAPRPLFLFNLGQCYRKLDDLTKAREMYQRYLRDAPPSDPERVEAQDELVEIDKLIAARPSPPPPVKTTKAEPLPRVAQPAPSLAPAPTAVTLTRAAPPPKKSFIKRHWWIIPVSVAVVGLAVGLGAYYGTRQSSQVKCEDATWCIDISQTGAPGSLDEIVLYGPRISTGACGLGSNVSNWLGPPPSQI